MSSKVWASIWAGFCFTILSPSWAVAQNPEEPFLESELIFPLEHWHNHASSIVELPNGDLLVCWFHGSGERTADDVVILGARKREGEDRWSAPFLMEDVPGFPDTNCTMLVDPRAKLWLIWPTILANEWHTALLKYRVTSDYLREGPPHWEVSRVLHIKPGDKFLETVENRLETLRPQAVSSGVSQERIKRYFDRNQKNAGDKLYRRLGWMTRAHPIVLDGIRLIVPLYSDGFSFSLMAITDDWGKHWIASTPLVGLGNIQPSIAVRKDGSLVTYMRDAGPPPKRLQFSESFDRGETWGPVVDTELPNPGSGAEVITLRNGWWVLIYNDLERGRYSLAVSLSDDEGRTWKWTRHLERDTDTSDPGDMERYHYPSIIQAEDGTFHVSYSYFSKKKSARLDSEGRPRTKSIKHAHFNEAWIREGDPQ